MFTEKLRSLLRFGSASTRYKDIFDMYYLGDFLDENRFQICLQSYILNDPELKEDSIEKIIQRISRTFSDSTYKQLLSRTDKRWLNDNIDDIFSKILEVIRNVGNGNNSRNS